MTAWRRAIEVSIGGEDLAKLVSITRSRTESAGRVERARMLLAYRDRRLLALPGARSDSLGADPTPTWAATKSNPGPTRRQRI